MSSNLYNIHNLISIEIDNGLENTNRVYDFLECIHNGSNQSANINKCYKVIVQKVDEISTSAHREYFNGIFISPNSLIDKNYGIEVFFNEDAIILKTKFRFIEWMMYSIQLALLRVDCVIIHGAAIAKDGNAVLFPSWGGVGKTAILNDFAKKYQHKIIGDDLFILDKKGNIFAFPKPMVLYPYHKNLFPEIFQKNPSLIPSGLSKYMSRLVPKVKKLLSPFPSLMNFARNHNPQVKWVLPTEVFGFDNVCWNSTVQKIFWLERSIEPSILQYDNPNLCSQILGSTINEFDQRVVYSINVLMGLGILSNDYYLKRWYEVLEAGLEMAKKGRINVNSSVTIDEIGEFIKDFLEKHEE